MKTGLLLVVLTAFLGVSVWFAARAWTGVETEMSGHGWFALTLGAVLSIALGAGLMALVFFSARRGYDDVDREPGR
jgi:hypothetical protein